MINVAKMRTNLEAFSNGFRSKKYDFQFNDFWLWKKNIEETHAGILDDRNFEEANKKLRKILSSWQTYRGTKNNYPYRDLKKALKNIEGSINEIKNVSLPELSSSDILNDLEIIWHELGSVKEPNGEKCDDGKYFIIAICKPLMLLWGQTLAFDARVRFGLSRCFETRYDDRKWGFSKWVEILMGISDQIGENIELLDFMNDEAEIRYGKNAIIPYGRFIDIYYFQQYN